LVGENSTFYLRLLLLRFDGGLVNPHSLELRKQGSISPTFYSQLLSAQIPKAQKDTDDLTVILVLLKYMRLKAARKTLVKSTPSLVNTVEATIASNST